jgi:hypothetical protein
MISFRSSFSNPGRPIHRDNGLLEPGWFDITRSALMIAIHVAIFCVFAFAYKLIPSIIEFRGSRNPTWPGATEGGDEKDQNVAIGIRLAVGLWRRIVRGTLAVACSGIATAEKEGEEQCREEY